MSEYKLPEQVNINHITYILKCINQKIKNIDGTNFDLSAVKNIDSAGVAFLAYLKSKYKDIKFKNSPAQIDNLCQLYKIQL